VTIGMAGETRGRCVQTVASRSLQLLRTATIAMVRDAAADEVPIMSKPHYISISTVTAPI
jgi:hypothetical protein